MTGNYCCNNYSYFVHLCNNAAEQKKKNFYLFFHSGCHKASIFNDKVPFTLHPWIGLIYTNTYAKKKKKICLS